VALDLLDHAMTSSSTNRPLRSERTRGRLRVYWDVTFRALRWIAQRAHGAYTTFGIFLLAGAVLAVAGTWIFSELAGHVTSGKTQAFDDAVLGWIGAHRAPWLTAAMVEVTSLGTGLVVMMTVVVAALFLWLTKHRHSAILLGIATAGGLVLNALLELGFGRPRPEVFDWGTHAASSSFPSGHAMNSVIVYGTVAYLAARLQERYAMRVATLLVAGLVILLVCASRLYLGVHYPSDVAAGLVIGLAWAAFCMATLEALQLYAKRNAPEMLQQEHPAPEHEHRGEPHEGSDPRDVSGAR
jgi:undecaprenyl-diphosphatase